MEDLQWNKLPFLHPARHSDPLLLLYSRLVDEGFQLARMATDAERTEDPRKLALFTHQQYGDHMLMLDQHHWAFTPSQCSNAD